MRAGAAPSIERAMDRLARASAHEAGAFGPTGAAAGTEPAGPRAGAAAALAGVAVSVAMPTYRRPDLLSRCLEALLAQDCPRDAYEIVVADDGPDDDTRATVERFAGQARARGGPAVRYAPRPPDGAKGPAAARNRGWRAARGAIVAFTDDDTIPQPDWLVRGAAAFEHGAAAAWGHVRMPIPAVPTDYERDAHGLEGAEFVTANCFVRRDALEAVGGFDERFGMAWLEDSDLHFSLLSRGFQVVPAPEAVVLHPVRPARWGVSVSQQKKSRFEALLYKKHPRLYRERIPHAAPPWRYYAIVAALAVAAGGLASGRPRLAAAGGAAWAAMTAQFALQRLRGTSRAPAHVAEMLATSAAIPPLAVFWRLAGAAKFKVPFA